MRKRKGQMIILCFFCVVFNGCASVNYRTPINSSMQPRNNKSYLYGKFFLQSDFMNKFRLALRFENTANGNISSIRLLNNQPVYAVEVAPGTYRLKDIIYAPLGAMMDFEVKKMTVPSEPEYLHNNIVAEPGKIYYLGDFSGASRRAGFGAGSSGGAFAVCVLFKGGLVGAKQNFLTTTEELKNLFPKFTNLEFNSAWGI